MKKKTITKTVEVNVATIEDFTNFLEERKALYKFMKNCNEVEMATYRVDRWSRQFAFVCSTNPLEEYIETFCHKGREGWHCLIVYAFIWNETREGLPYWSKLSKEWQDWLYTNNIEDFEI